MAASVLSISQRFPWAPFFFVLAGSTWLVWLGLTDSHSWYPIVGEEISIGSIAMGGVGMVFSAFAGLRILLCPMLVIDRQSRSLESHRSWVVNVERGGRSRVPVDLPCSLAGASIEVRPRIVLITTEGAEPVKVIVRRQALSSDSLVELVSFFERENTGSQTSPPYSDGAT